MDSLIVNIAGGLDSLRARVLRQTMSHSKLRRAFVSRSARLSCLFAFVAASALLTSSLFPLWVLLLGPMIYGFPHLFATIRYVPESFGPSLNTSGKKAIFSASTALFAALAVARIFSNSDLALLEIGGVLAVYAALAIWLRPTLGVLLRGAVLVGALAYATYTVPLLTAGVLLLGHNFVAFIYWITTARSAKDRRVAIFATLAFIAATAAIFLGVFDGVYKLFTPTAEINWAELDYASIGRSITPWSENYQLWFHAVVAYAFGQSLHYFVWMKAIPDQLNPAEVPTSFRQSYSGLKRDFGSRYVLLMLLAVAAGLIAWGFMHYPAARTLYFSIAAFHGYFEIAGLAFATRKLA